MTRQAAPIRPPVVLTIAGSDSGGGAGVQADLKTIEAGGAFGTSAITNVTAQNTRGVESTHGLPIAEIEAQIDAVVDDFDVAAVKTGMLGTSDGIETVLDYAEQLPNLVVDPVMVAASGDRLLEPAAESAYEALIAEATLVTPNADEAKVLTGVTVTDVEAAREAGRHLVEMGSDAALLKGGHVPGEDVVDVLVTAETTHTFRHDRIDTDATHGSGCMLSSAIATRLAHGADLTSAVGDGVSLIASAVRYGNDVGEGPGAVHHLVETRNAAARADTVDGVEHVLDLLVGRDVPPMVPDDGIDVVGATPSAESPRDVAGVDGGLAPTRDGLRPNRGVSFDAGGRLAGQVLAVREVDPEVRFAVDCHRSPSLEDAFSTLSGRVLHVPADDEAAAAPLTQRVRSSVNDGAASSVVGLDDASAGDRLPLFAPDAETLRNRTKTLLEALED